MIPDTCSIATTTIPAIGMFDSGVGGLTVLSEMQKRLPYSNFIYFGDTARCPYGPKSDKTIIRYSIENGIFLIDQGIDLLVVACNTASALALEKLENTFQIPVIGVIKPAVEEAIQKTCSKRIGVIGTRATIQSGIYQKELHKHLENAHVVAQACPLFVPIVEEEFQNKQASRLIIQEYLAPIKAEKVDTLLLGCTHYPLLEELIREEMGDDVHMINPAVACALQVQDMNKKKSYRVEHTNKKETLFFVSDDPKRFQSIGERFFNTQIPYPQLVTSLL